MNILINQDLSKSYFGSMPYDPDIIMVLDEVDWSIDFFRSSKQLRELLQDIISVLLNEKKIISSWGTHFITIRLEAMQSLLVEQLCIPHLFDILGLGMNVHGMMKRLFSSSPASSSSSGDNSAASHVMLTRLKGILLEAFTLIKLAEESCLSVTKDGLLESEVEQSLDERRCYLFLHLMDFKTSALLPHAVTIRQYSAQALEALTCHILSISAVSSVLRESIQRVVTTLANELSDERKTKSNIPDNIPALRQILMRYFSYLHQHATMLIKDSRKDEIVMSVNANLRTSLRNECYTSPMDIITFFHQKYQSKLTHLPIPLQSYSMEDMEQARKDIIRDNITLNKVPYYGGNCAKKEITAWDAIRDEIKKVLIFSLAVDRPELFELDHGNPSSSMLLTDAENKPRSTSKSSSDLDTIESAASSLNSKFAEDLLDSIPPPPPSVVSSSLSEKQPSTPKAASLMPPRQSSVNFSTSDLNETEAFLRKMSSSNNSFGSPSLTMTTRGSSSRNPSLNGQYEDNSSSNNSNGSTATPQKESNTMFLYLPQQLQNNQYFYADILSILHAYTVLATSRTFAGGDAFIILNDLYGGEGLMLMPFVMDGGRKRANSKPPATPPRSNNSSAKMRLESDEDVRIAITTTGIKVMVKERYRLFATAMLETCSDINRLQPLMCFECTTTTLLILCNETIASLPFETPMEGSIAMQGHERAYRLFQLLITHPQLICHRAVSIEPFMA